MKSKYVDGHGFSQVPSVVAKELRVKGYDPGDYGNSIIAARDAYNRDQLAKMTPQQRSCVQYGAYGQVKQTNGPKNPFSDPEIRNKTDFTLIRYASMTAYRLKKEGFNLKRYGNSLKMTIAAYNQHLEKKIDRNIVPELKYLPNGMLAKPQANRRWDSTAARIVCRKMQFHSAYWIHPSVGRGGKGSPLANSEKLMKEALKRYGDQEHNGADVLQILLCRMFEEALNGDRHARQEILARAMPIPKDSTLQLLDGVDLDNVDAKALMGGLVKQLATGQISPTDSRVAFSSLETLYRVETFEKLERRLDAVESQRVVSTQSVEQSRASAEDSGILIESTDDEA